jgi:ABC-2 type transport system ATP-binding protein
MLTTRTKPTSGRAVVAGIDVVAQPALARRYLAAVTQTNTLDRALSIFDNLFFHGLYFGLSRGESKKRAWQLLDRFQLTERAKEPVDTLSGGLAQRVQIARALLHQPRVLFLDEPTAGLDPQSRFQLWQTLTQLNKDGQTIVLTTHYMDEAETLCERLAIIDHGQLLALDTPVALKALVKADRFIVLTLPEGEVAAARAAVEKVDGVHRVEAGEKGVLRVFSRAAPGLTGSVVTAVTNAGAEIRDLSVTEPTLETVFLELTGKEYRE